MGKLSHISEIKNRVNKMIKLLLEIYYGIKHRRIMKSTFLQVWTYDRGNRKANRELAALKKAGKKMEE